MQIRVCVAVLLMISVCTAGIGWADLYVADTGNNCIRIFNDEGLSIGEWGREGTGAGEFRAPVDIAAGAAGEVYVLDNNNARVQVFTASGEYLREFGTAGSAAGQFDNPNAITIDALGRIYVVDTGNHRVQVFDSKGKFLCNLGHQGAGDGEFLAPVDVAIHPAGEIYVTDSQAFRVNVFIIVREEREASGSRARFIGSFGREGIGNGEFTQPVGIVAGPRGDIYVTDAAPGTSKVHRFTDDGYHVKTWGEYGAGRDEMDFPQGITTDAAGNVYVVDVFNGRVKVFTRQGSLKAVLAEDAAGRGLLNMPGGIAWTPERSEQ